MFIRTLGSAVGIAVFGSIANSVLGDRFRHPPAAIAGQLPRAVDAASISFTKRHQSAAAIDYTRAALYDAVHYVFWALLGVGLTIITGNPLFDALGTLFIGALLILVALILGIETKSLLIGEGASPENVATIRDAINAHPTVESLIHMKTLYLGPDELMIAAKVAFPKATRLVEIATAIDALEADIRTKIPTARVIYIEPDLFHAPGAGNPATDAIVIKGSD